MRDCDVYLQYLYLVDGIRQVKRVVDLSPQQYMMFEQCRYSCILTRHIFELGSNHIFPDWFSPDELFPAAIRDVVFIIMSGRFQFEVNTIITSYKWFIKTSFQRIFKLV